MAPAPRGTSTKLQTLIMTIETKEQTTVKKCAVCSRIFRYGALYLNILKSEILSTILEQQACMVCYYLINLQNHLLYNSVVVLTYIYFFFQTGPEGPELEG